MRCKIFLQLFVSSFAPLRGPIVAGFRILGNLPSFEDEQDAYKLWKTFFHEQI